MVLPGLANLDAIGWAIIHFLWQGVLIGLVSALMLAFIPRKSTDLRYLVACVALLASLGVFLVTLMVMGGRAESADAAVGGPAAINADVILVEPLVASAGDMDVQAVMPLQQSPLVGRSELSNWLMPVIVLAWFIGMLAMSLRFARCWGVSWSLRRHGTREPSNQWRAMFESLKADMGIPPAVRILQSTVVDTPMVLGFFRPVVIFPLSVFTSLAEDEVRMLFMHELAHLRRRDHLVNLMQGIVEILLFFHPVVWWLSRQVRIEREHCCDDAAIRRGIRPRQLARTLVRLESLRLQSQPSSTAILSASGGSLMKRIERLVMPSSANSREAIGWRTPLALTTGLVIAIGCLFQVNATATADGVVPEGLEQDGDDGDGLYSKKEIERDLQEGMAGGHLDQEGADRIMAVWNRYARGVKEGRISSVEARMEFDARIGKMFGDDDGDRRNARKIKSERGNRFGLFMVELGEAVNRGELSAEDAVRKLMAMADRMNISVDESEERSELDELKENIEGRLRQLGEGLRRQVAAGEITREEMEQRYEQAERRMMSRIRAAEMDRKEADAGSRELKELKARIEVQIKANGEELGAMVKAGKISEADAKARYEELERRLWTQYRAAEMEAAGDAPKGGTREEGRRISRAEYQEAVEKMSEMVKAGKITREQMEQRLEGMKRAMAEQSEEKDGKRRRR